MVLLRCNGVMNDHDKRRPVSDDVRWFCRCPLSWHSSKDFLSIHRYFHRYPREWMLHAVVVDWTIQLAQPAFADRTSSAWNAVSLPKFPVILDGEFDSADKYLPNRSSQRDCPSTTPFARYLIPEQPDHRSIAMDTDWSEYWMDPSLRSRCWRYHVEQWHRFRWILSSTSSLGEEAQLWDNRSPIWWM